MVLASLVFLMKSSLEKSRQLQDYPESSSLCFGGPSCVCIGGRVGDMCLLTFVGLMALLITVCAVVFCACTGACCFAQCMKKPAQVTYIDGYAIQGQPPLGGRPIVNHAMVPKNDLA